MDDETTEETTYSDDSDSFIVSDDLEDDLIWDSDESRPPGPSPPSSANMNDSPAYGLRSRLRRRTRRRVNVEPETQSDNESLGDTTSQASSDVELIENHNDRQDDDSESDVTVSDLAMGDTDDTQPMFEPRSPSLSPQPVRDPVIVDNINHGPRPVFEPRSPSVSPVHLNDNAGPGAGSGFFVPTSPVHPPNRADTPIPRSPEYPPPGLQDQGPDVQVVEEVPVTNEVQPSATKSSLATVPEPAAAMNVSTLSESEDSSLCSICMDPLTNSGKHRIVCLRCGHIFGQSCVERWIKVGCNNGARRCPTCNKKASLKDVRILYLPKVVPLDTVEKDRLIREKEEIAAQKAVIEMELSRCKLQNELNSKQYKEQLKQAEEKLKEAARMIEMLSEGKKVSVLPQSFGVKRDGVRVELLQSVDITKEGGCRVLAFSTGMQELVVSQPSGNTLFAGFGVRVLNSVDWQPYQFVFLHSKMIRDLAFHSDDRGLLLSASLDGTAKLTDLLSNSVVHTFKGEGPLWSCCWDTANPHQLLVGSHLGKVCLYDRRMTDHYLHLWETSGNMTPVVALASVPPGPGVFPQGGFLSCRLNKVFAYPRRGEMYLRHELSLEGPFMSMRYDAVSHSLLTGCRPSTRCLNARVHLNQITTDAMGEVCLPQIHTFNCGTSARVLSRLATLPAVDDTLVAAHHESGRSVNLWSCKTGNLVDSVSIKEPVIDLASMTFPNKCLLATLSDKKVGIYKVTY